MAINPDDQQIYEHLIIIIDAFEKAAIESGTKRGAMVAALGPLSGFDLLLDSSSSALIQATNKDVRPNRAIPQPSQDGEVIDGSFSHGAFTSSASLNFSNPIQASSVELTTPEISGSLDLDLAELDGFENIASAWQECFGCDFRASFDWQVKPLNLLGPIDTLLKQIETSVDGFGKHLDSSNKGLSELCKLLNQFKGICLADQVLLMMGQKFLLKKYMADTLDIKLDWTVVLGPLLKIIVEGISSLLGKAGSVFIGPLSCIETGFTVAAKIEDELTGSFETLKRLTQNNLFLETGFSSNLVSKNLSISSSGTGSSRSDETFVPTFIPAGIDIDAYASLSEGLKDPQFMAQENLLSNGLILTIRQIISYVQGLLNSIDTTLESINSICSGGLSVSLNNLGTIIFILDTYAVLKTIYTLLKANPKVTDWCSFLETNPGILEEVLSNHIPGVVVEKTSAGTLTLRQGPQVVGKINTCVNQRTGVDQQTLNQWIKDLESGL